MEFEIYESELADYSLQDSPFYEANTPIIFGSTQSILASNNSASMVDALNLSSKKSSIMMSTKCQSHKLAYERTANGNANGKRIDGHSNHINDTPDTPSKRRNETAERFYSMKHTDLDINAETNIQTKKKRKCVSFLPTNYVQVNSYFILFFFFFWPIFVEKPQLL